MYSCKMRIHTSHPEKRIFPRVMASVLYPGSNMITDQHSDCHLFSSNRNVCLAQTLLMRVVLIHSNRAIAIAAGQSILVTTLSKELVKLATGVPVEAIIKAGPLNLSRITNSSAVLTLLRTAYNRGIHNVLIYSLTAICTAMPFALDMQWLDVKKVAQKGSDSRATTREERKQES